VSSTSIKVLDITAMAINQGFISGCAWGWELILGAGDSTFIRFDLSLIGFSEILILLVRHAGNSVYGTLFGCLHPHAT
jgi:hypothetical protein